MFRFDQSAQFRWISVKISKWNHMKDKIRHEIYASQLQCESKRTIEKMNWSFVSMFMKSEVIFYGQCESMFRKTATTTFKSKCSAMNLTEIRGQSWTHATKTTIEITSAKEWTWKFHYLFNTRSFQMTITDRWFLSVFWFIKEFELENDTWLDSNVKFELLPKNLTLQCHCIKASYISHRKGGKEW